MRTALSAIAMLAASILAAAAGSARAQDAAYNGNGATGFPSSKAVAIPVTATVGVQCQFTGAGLSAVRADTDLTDGFTVADVPLPLKCTSAFRIGVQSSKGALDTGATGLPTGYTARYPYEVALHVETGTVAGSSTGSVDQGPCLASTLTPLGGVCSFKGPAAQGSTGLVVPGPSVNQTAYLRFSGPSADAGSGGTAVGGQILVASNAGYTDTLTVTLSPQ